MHASNFRRLTSFSVPTNKTKGQLGTCSSVRPMPFKSLRVSAISYLPFPCPQSVAAIDCIKPLYLAGFTQNKRANRLQIVVSWLLLPFPAPNYAGVEYLIVFLTSKTMYPSPLRRISASLPRRIMDTAMTANKIRTPFSAYCIPPID